MTTYDEALAAYSEALKIKALKERSPKELGEIKLEGHYFAVKAEAATSTTGVTVPVATTKITPDAKLPRSWQLAQLAVEHAPSALLYGLPGTGKSFAALQAKHPAGLIADGDIFALTLHDDAAVSDLIGGYLPIDGHWTWRDGPAVQAWKASQERPSRLVLNEIDRAAGPLHTALLAILDSPRSARLTLPTGETVTPNPENFQVVSTMNGVPQDLDAALLDRHVASIRLDEPHPDSIAALPENMQKVAATMSASKVRNSGRGTTPRDWHALAALEAAGLSLSDAAEMVWADRSKDIITHLAIEKVAPARAAR